MSGGTRSLRGCPCNVFAPRHVPMLAPQLHVVFHVAAIWAGKAILDGTHKKGPLRVAITAIPFCGSAERGPPLGAIVQRPAPASFALPPWFGCAIDHIWPGNPPFCDRQHSWP